MGKINKLNWQLSQIVGFFAMFLLISMGMGFGNLDFFIDMPSLQFVLMVTIASGYFSSSILTMTNLQKVIFGQVEINSKDELYPYFELIDSMSRVALASGAIGTLIGLMFVFGDLGDVIRFGPNVALSFLTLVYGLIISQLILQPVKNQIRERYYSQFGVWKEIETVSIDGTIIDTKEQLRVKSILVVTIIVISTIIVTFGFIISKILPEEPSTVWSPYSVNSVTVDNIRLHNFSAELLEYEIDSLRYPTSKQEIDSLQRWYANTVEGIPLSASIELTPRYTINERELISSISLCIYEYNKESGEHFDGQYATFDYPLIIGEKINVRYAEDGFSFEMDILLDTCVMSSQ